MSSEVVAVWCLVFIAGLLATGLPWGGIGVFAVGLIGAIVLGRLRPGHLLLTPRVWLVAGLIGLMAGFYLHLRSPQPSPSDISRFVPDKMQEVTVYGRVEELPRLTRSGKWQLWFAATQLQSQPVTGRLYVTVEQENAIDLYPGKAVGIVGTLYTPKPALNPGGFDFQKYLTREGSFAGFKGTKILLDDFNQQPQWGGWMIQQRIVRSQADRLGEREGALLSAMVLGNRSVNIPFEIKDAFQRVGMSHALAASGFQVSLILGVILAGLRRCSPGVRVLGGAAGLLMFGGLAGLQPAVSRAIVMGFAILAGIQFERKVKPLGSLLLAATTLLVIQPTWIWDVGFQLSVLATLGLLVTAGALNKRLDWLPNTISPAISVPLAAFLWTLPLQLYYFGVVSPYSIIVNIVTTLLISIVSIGGMVSALLALISPVAGSVSAWLLYYPLHFLIEIVIFCCKLPGNSFAVGTISSLLLLALYGLICLPWMRPTVQRWWPVLLGLGMCLVFIPAWYGTATLFRVSAIAAPSPILVIQDHGRVGLVNTGDATTAALTVVPFLQKQGINQIDWALAVNAAEGWSAIASQISIKALYDLSDPQQPALDPAAMPNYTRLKPADRLQIGGLSVRFISQDPTLIQLDIGQARWLWLKDIPNKKERGTLGDLQNYQVLWWSGRRLHPQFLEGLKPSSAIAYSNVDRETLAQLQRSQVSVYSTAQEGALTWTPQQGFELALDRAD